MPANVEIDPATANAQGTDFQTTAFQTEDGGQSRYLTTFSYAGGSSTYSFGLYQFDALGNPLVAPFLGAIGFSGPEIAELQQHGGLSSSTLNALDSQLSAAVATQSGQAAYQGLLNTSDANYAQAVQTDLDDASTTIASQVLSDPVAIQRLYDLNNQFGTATLGQLQTFLGGDTATPPGGDAIE